MYELATTVLAVLQDYSEEAMWVRLEKPLPDYLSRSDTMIRVLYYPPLETTESPEALRAAPHEDINFVTLLPAATQSGLQIRPRQSSWQSVTAPEGAIVGNIGDMLGNIDFNIDRVINPVGNAGRQARVTAPLFCHPESSLQLSDRYTAGSYLRERLNEINTRQLRTD